MSDLNAVETVVGEVKDRVDAAGEAAKAIVGIAVPIPGDLLQEVTNVVNAQEQIVGDTAESIIDHLTEYANRILDLIPKVAAIGTG